MLKVILDTNQFVSAFLFGGMTKIVFDLVLNNKLELYVSEDFKVEVLAKFKYYGASEQALLDASLFLDAKGIAITPKTKVSVCRDPEDNYLLALAEEAQAGYLVTRDKDLLDLSQKKWKNTKIVKPEEFLPYLRSLKLI